MKKIVVLNQGWVVVGDFRQEEEVVIVDNASVIRRWGTTAGLGELALKGPLKATVLDPCGLVRVLMRNVVFILDTAAELW